MLITIAINHFNARGKFFIVSLLAGSAQMAKTAS
jgi:hypothetical protein